MLHLAGVLSEYGVSDTSGLKLYRHTNSLLAKRKHGKSLEDLYRSGELELYQSAQASHVLGENLVAFFMAEGGRRSRFLGLWNVRSITQSLEQRPNAMKALRLGFIADGEYWYELDRSTTASELIDRLIVEWPATGRHHQWLHSANRKPKNLPVLEIRSTPLTRAFPGFGEVCLSFTELEHLINGDVAGWREPLSSVHGIYLIADRKNGALYVGSAYSERGIWGRWSEYAQTGHGNNALMVEALQTGLIDQNALVFSILQTMGNAVTMEECLAAERVWKKKLGPKAVTLNGN